MQDKSMSLLSKIIAVAILIPLTAIVFVVLSGIAVRLFQIFFS